MTLLHALKRAWFALRDRRDRAAAVTDRIGNGAITWNPRHIAYLRAYHGYCVALFADVLVRSGAALHLVFDDYPAAATGLPLRRIGFQIEHTLVKPGGGGSAGAARSNTPLADGSGHYLARVLHLDALRQCDRVVEYSAANLAHLQAAGGFGSYLERVLPLAPLLFEADFGASHRNWQIMTLFGDAEEGRRGRFLRNARAAGLPVRNRKRCFEPERLRQAFRRCRILVNVRRSDHHDTLEELRVLPALLCGVVVVSEDVPLRETIPYQRFVVWARYEDLPATVARVHADYAAWHARIFGDPALPAVLRAMRAGNLAAIDQALAAMCEKTGYAATGL